MAGSMTDMLMSTSGALRLRVRLREYSSQSVLIRPSTAQKKMRYRKGYPVSRLDRQTGMTQRSGHELHPCFLSHSC